MNLFGAFDIFGIHPLCEKPTLIPLSLARFSGRRFGFAGSCTVRWGDTVVLFPALEQNIPLIGSHDSVRINPSVAHLI